MPAVEGSGVSLEQLIDQLQSEAQPLKRHRFLQTVRDLWQPTTVARLYEESGRLILVNVASAERLARAAEWISRQIDDPFSRAEGLRAVGHILFLKGRHDSAWQHYEKAAAIYEQLGKETQLGRTLSGALQCLGYLGRYDHAMQSAARAREIFTRHGDRLRLARLDMNLGNLVFRQDRFEEALEYYRRAVDTFTQIGDAQDVGITLKNMATCQIFLNDFRDALDTYRRARAHAIEHAMPLLAAGADYNIAYLYYLKGEYTRAIEMYGDARTHCHALGDTYREGLCDLDQGEMYLELNLSEEGAHLARRALGAFRKLGMDYEAGKAVTNLAISASHHGHTALALELFRKARDFFVEEKNHAWIAISDLYQALVFYQDHRLHESRLLAETALRFFADSPFVSKTILTRLLLTRIHLDAGRAGEAKAMCEQTLGLLEQSESPALIYQTYFIQGLLEENLGDAGRAHQAYLKAHAELEKLRSHLKTEELKVAFLKDKLEIYESLVRMSLSGGDSPNNWRAAFGYIEQAKSRSLADLIAFRAHNLPASTERNREQVEQIASLREELTWCTRAMQSLESKAVLPRDPRIEKLRRTARQCEQRLVELMANLKVKDQEFASLHAAGTIELEAIQSVLPDGAMLLQYYRVADTFHACLLSRTGLKMAPLGSASDLRRRLQLLRFQLSKFRLGPEYVRTFQHQLLEATNAHLREFYQALIEPIRRELDAEHLIVAPHDFLHYLPFHALLDGETYLDDRYSISYSPSASIYYLCATKPRGAQSGALVLGIPDPVAPQILEEVKAVSSAIPGSEVHLGADATLDVLRAKGARSRFIHIATHGSFRQDNPMFSSIQLGTSQLSLFDLYQLSLPSELITLSGCGTGLNVVVGGDELLGLKRGLLYAGAQGVLLTLWDVNDQSTAEFMELFYRHLASAPHKAEALRLATRHIREKYAHPFYWAPFVLVGKYA